METLPRPEADRPDQYSEDDVDQAAAYIASLLIHVADEAFGLAADDRIERCPVCYRPIPNRLGHSCPAKKERMRRTGTGRASRLQ